MTSARSILLVDDNPDDAGRIQRMLRGQRRHYDVTVCRTAAEAFGQLQVAQFDCVLLDYHLPDSNGNDFLRKLGAGSRVAFPAAVCVLTGHDDDATASRALELGAEDYLLKDTLEPHGLVRAIENVIERFAIRRQLEQQRAALDLRNARLESMRDELASRLVELEEASRTRDRFVAMMSHEMRTPLNAILGYAELLEMEIDGPMNDFQRRNIERIRIGSHHLLELINNVLDLARVDARKLELDLRPINIAALMEEVSALLEHEAQRKGIVLRVVTAPSPPLVDADLQRVRQILLNLLGNAIKFTEDGHVELRAAPSAAGDMVEICVVDTGIGIDPVDIADVFKEFFQVDDGYTRVRGGSGLGLAISQRLARAMGGDIHVTSALSQGSVFTLSLPVARAGSEVRTSDTAQHEARMAGIRAPVDDGEAQQVSVTVVAFAGDASALEVLERQVEPDVRLVWTVDPLEVPGLVQRERATLVILEVGPPDGQVWNVAQNLSDLLMKPQPAVLLLPQIVAPPLGGKSVHAPVDLGWVALVPKPFTSEQLTRAVSTAGRRERIDTTCDVLVIDDDEDSRRVAKRFLAEQGAVVREVSDGETGLMEMRRRPPDVAVLDLMMPVLDGFGVLATMRADPLLSSVPVVVLTAKTLTEAERKFLSRTAVRVLQKGEHRLSDVASLVVRAAAGAREA